MHKAIMQIMKLLSKYLPRKNK